MFGIYIYINIMYWKRENTIYWHEALLRFQWNARFWDCFPRESPQIKPHPERSSQYSRSASVSTIWLQRPGFWNVSHHGVTHPGFCLNKLTFQLAFPSLFRIRCLASGAFMMLVLHLPEDMFLEKNWVSHFCFSARAVDLAVIPGKSNILEVTGFVKASD